MNMERAKQIYESPDTFAVHLEGQSVWIENIDEPNGMATVQVGGTPQNTKTVSVERLHEGKADSRQVN
ncbi:H-type small acid-soluble spore protein [Paenibacillus beijingensis]|uniref:Spore protein n=1 Tax=Paenibacillus beijingensis TaxID=1126833 RepID=A0A0D5NFA7_9BACL|nr:H-type small acid-soluble spore protein [Paenibacillus beijingensis]AJY73936.1 spore protein [Paenibacillus beijingensis]